MPLIRTRVKSGPRPRTESARPSPWSRLIATPGMRWIDSAKLLSGNFAMSSARIESTTPVLLRFSSSARCKLLRKPVTTTSVTALSSAAAASWPCAIGAASAAGAGGPPAVAIASPAWATPPRAMTSASRRHRRPGVREPC